MYGMQYILSAIHYFLFSGGETAGKVTCCKTIDADDCSDHICIQESPSLGLKDRILHYI